jgi:uncharacterized protein (UPF0128 family)
MNKREIREKLRNVMDDALKINNVSQISEDMLTETKHAHSEMAFEALMCGYAKMLTKAHNDIRYIWLHLYDIDKALEEDIRLESEAPANDKTDED